MNVSAHKVLDNNSIFVKVFGAAATAATPRIPIHLITVIDTSGSMAAGNRLINVKNSLQYMLPYMSSDDMFSLVSFSDVSNVKCQNLVLTTDGKRQAEGHIHGLCAFGSTNMGSALIAVSDIIATAPADHTTCVMILTDGEVTTGITEPDALVNLVQSVRSSRANTTVYSVGYGAHHNFDLMRAFAHEGSGSYSVVENLEHVATVFGDVLGGLLSIVAQNCEILLPNEAEVITKLRVTTEPTCKKVPLGNLYDGSQQSLSVRGLPINPDGSRTVNYRYFDSATRTIITTHITADNESGGDISQEAAAFMLRIESADLMGRIADFTVTVEMLQDILPRLRAIQHVTWVPGTIAEFERVVQILINNPRMPMDYALRSITGAAANNAAVLSSARGVSMMSQSYDPSDPTGVSHAAAIDSVFSTPMQRHVSRGISGVVTQAAHTSLTPSVSSMNVGGGGAGAPPALIRSRAICVAPSSLSPIPSFDERLSGARSFAAALTHIVIPPYNPSTFDANPLPVCIMPRHSGEMADTGDLGAVPPMPALEPIPSSAMMDEGGSDPIEPSQAHSPIPTGYMTPPRRLSTVMRHSPPRQSH